MTTKRSTPKFRRTAPALRREALVEATLRCLKEFGHEGMSIRRISAAAGVSIGLINHHFPNKSCLVAETYEALTLSLQGSIRAHMADQDASPRDRLSGFFNAFFSPEILDPQVFHVWLVFWSMVKHCRMIRAVHDRTYGAHRAMLESLLEQLVLSGVAPAFQLRPAAIALSALLDGFWVELSLSSTTFDAGEAIESCEDWVDALCAGSFPRLLQVQAGAEPCPARNPANRAASTLPPLTTMPTR